MISNSTANAFRANQNAHVPARAEQAGSTPSTVIEGPRGTHDTSKTSGGSRPRGVVHSSRSYMPREKIVKKILAQPGFTKPTGAELPEGNLAAFDAPSVSTWSESAWNTAESAKNWAKDTWDSARNYYLRQRAPEPKVCQTTTHATEQCGLASPERKADRPAKAFIDDAHAHKCKTQMSPSLAARLAKDPNASLDGTIVFVADIDHGDQQIHQEMEELILRHYEGGSILGDVAPDDMLVEAGRHCRDIYWRHWNPLGGACNKIDDESLKDKLFAKHGPAFEKAAADVLRLYGQPVPDGFYERFNAILPLLQEAYSTQVSPEKQEACSKAWNIYQQFHAEVEATWPARDRHMLKGIRELAFDPDGKHIDNKVIWFTIGSAHWDTMKKDLMAIGDVLYVEKNKQS